ncbi:MAG: phosphate ABC transporter ATP-binding protein [Candidatus Zixiibacteriota bacterium]|nr:MAG: phosphate ABC transporter ATP-binding protein [candidate division Zixibacteria bacterium]
MTDIASILEVRHLSREVNTGEGLRKVVDDFSFCFHSGTITTILGPSGAGKSSLLRLLNRLDEPGSGEVLLDGSDYRECDPCALRRKVGYLFQAPHLFGGTVADNIRYADPLLDDNGIDELLLLASVSLDMKDTDSSKLSGGEKQRVALARLLATNPDVLLLDEPTSSLDPTYTDLIEKVILESVTARNLAVVMVCHLPQQAVRMSGEGLLLVDGRLVEHGPVRDLVENPTTELGRRYRDRELT